MREMRQLAEYEARRCIVHAGVQTWMLIVGRDSECETGNIKLRLAEHGG